MYSRMNKAPRLLAVYYNQPITLKREADIVVQIYAQSARLCPAVGELQTSVA